LAGTIWPRVDGRKGRSRQSDIFQNRSPPVSKDRPDGWNEAWIKGQHAPPSRARVCAGGTIAGSPGRRAFLVSVLEYVTRSSFALTVFWWRYASSRRP